MKNLEIEKAVNTIKSGGIILYPTDTIWGIGCDATNNNAIKKIFKLKNRIDSKAMISLVADITQLKKITKIIPEFDITSQPTTVIYPQVSGIDKSLLVHGSAAVRIVQDEFCKELIQKINKPLVSTSANISGEKSPSKFSEINIEIIKNVDYIVNLRKNEIRKKPSQIFKLTKNGNLIKIR